MYVFYKYYKNMGSHAIFSHNSLWSILDIVCEYTKNNKVEYILPHGSIWEMGVTTPGSTMHYNNYGHIDFLYWLTREKL